MDIWKYKKNRITKIMMIQKHDKQKKDDKETNEQS